MVAARYMKAAAWTVVVVLLVVLLLRVDLMGRQVADLREPRLPAVFEPYPTLWPAGSEPFPTRRPAVSGPAATNRPCRTLAPPVSWEERLARPMLDPPRVPGAPDPPRVYQAPTTDLSLPICPFPPIPTPRDFTFPMPSFDFPGVTVPDQP